MHVEYREADRSTVPRRSSSDANFWSLGRLESSVWDSKGSELVIFWGTVVWLLEPSSTKFLSLCVEAIQVGAPQLPHTREPQTIAFRFLQVLHENRNKTYRLTQMKINSKQEFHSHNFTEQEKKKRKSIERKQHRQFPIDPEGNTSLHSEIANFSERSTTDQSADLNVLVWLQTAGWPSNCSLTADVFVWAPWVWLNLTQLCLLMSLLTNINSPSLFLSMLETWTGGSSWPSSLQIFVTEAGSYGENRARAELMPSSLWCGKSSSISLFSLWQESTKCASVYGPFSNKWKVFLCVGLDQLNSETDAHAATGPSLPASFFLELFPNNSENYFLHRIMLSNLRWALVGQIAHSVHIWIGDSEMSDKWILCLGQSYPDAHGGISDPPNTSSTNYVSFSQSILATKLATQLGEPQKYKVETWTSLFSDFSLKLLRSDLAATWTGLGVALNCRGHRQNKWRKAPCRPEHRSFLNPLWSIPPTDTASLNNKNFIARKCVFQCLAMHCNPYRNLICLGAENPLWMIFVVDLLLVTPHNTKKLDLIGTLLPPELRNYRLDVVGWIRSLGPLHTATNQEYWSTAEMSLHLHQCPLSLSQRFHPYSAENDTATTKGFKQSAKPFETRVQIFASPKGQEQIHKNVQFCRICRHAGRFFLSKAWTHCAAGMYTRSVSYESVTMEMPIKAVFIANTQHATPLSSRKLHNMFFIVKHVLKVLLFCPFHRRRCGIYFRQSLFSFNLGTKCACTMAPNNISLGCIQIRKRCRRRSWQVLQWMVMCCSPDKGQELCTLSTVLISKQALRAQVCLQAMRCSFCVSPANFQQKLRKGVILELLVHSVCDSWLDGLDTLQRWMMKRYGEHKIMAFLQQPSWITGDHIKHC